MSLYLSFDCLIIVTGLDKFKLAIVVNEYESINYIKKTFNFVFNCRQWFYMKVYIIYMKHRFLHYLDLQ